MNFPHLTDAEILDMVAPLKQPAAIVRWFKVQGFTVRPKPNGMPLITRTHFEAHLSTAPQGTTAQESDASNTPDVAGFLEKFKKGVGYGSNGTPKNQQPLRT